MRCLDDDAWYQKIISKTKITLYVGTAYERKIHCPQNRKVQTCQFHRSASSRRASGNVLKSQRSRTRRFTLSLSQQPVTWQKTHKLKTPRNLQGFLVKSVWRFSELLIHDSHLAILMWIPVQKVHWPKIRSTSRQDLCIYVYIQKDLVIFGRICSFGFPGSAGMPHGFFGGRNGWKSMEQYGTCKPQVKTQRFKTFLL